MAVRFSLIQNSQFSVFLNSETKAEGINPRDRIFSMGSVLINWGTIGSIKRTGQLAPIRIAEHSRTQRSAGDRHSGQPLFPCIRSKECTMRARFKAAASVQVAHFHCASTVVDRNHLTAFRQPPCHRPTRKLGFHTFALSSEQPDERAAMPAQL